MAKNELDMEVEKARKLVEVADRIKAAGVKEGQYITVGGKFASENDYEMFVGARGIISTISNYNGSVSVILENTRLIIVQLEDCLPAQ